VRWACAAVVVAIAGSGCAVHGSHAAAPLGGSRTSWRYEVVPVAGGDELAIEAWLPAGSLSDLVVKGGADPFVRDVEVEDEDGWSGVPRRGASFHVPECSRGCHLRYRFALRGAARALHAVDGAKAWGPVLEASPSLWLLHPTLAPAGTRYRFRVPPAAGEQGTAFVTGVFAAADGPPDTYEAEAVNIGVAPYAAFGPMQVHHVEAVSGTTLDVAVVPGSLAVDDAAILDWASNSARTMARFFGCFPIERVMLLVVPDEGATVRHGETMGDGGASIVVEVGEHATREALDDDWVLPHEMTHLAVPSLSRKHHWLEEGLAVYLQPIARARAGEIPPEEVWREFAAGMPKGMPASGSEALDGARDWARVYWGGATFCLMADLEIRTRTRNRLGLEDALRGVLASGGSVATVWDLQRVLETADAAVGVPVLESIHDQIQRHAWNVDLPSLFRALGVVVEGRDVRLVDDAPLAPLRRAITEPPPEGAPEPAACPFATPSRMAQR
jgi:hypothetical protein